MKERKPIEIDRVDMIFGGSAMKILPPMEEIPEEFQNRNNPWNQWASEWFCQGLSGFPNTKEGIEEGAALSNLKCVMGSYSPKHEHKIAGVAYLASLWLESTTP